MTHQAVMGPYLGRFCPVQYRPLHYENPFYEVQPRLKRREYITPLPPGVPSVEQRDYEAELHSVLRNTLLPSKESLKRQGQMQQLMDAVTKLQNMRKLTQTKSLEKELEGRPDALIYVQRLQNDMETYAKEYAEMLAKAVRSIYGEEESVRRIIPPAPRPAAPQQQPQQQQQQQAAQPEQRTPIAQQVPPGQPQPSIAEPVGKQREPDAAAAVQDNEVVENPAVENPDANVVGPNTVIVPIGSKTSWRGELKKSTNTVLHPRDKVASAILNPRTKSDGRIADKHIAALRGREQDWWNNLPGPEQLAILQRCKYLHDHEYDATSSNILKLIYALDTGVQDTFDQLTGKGHNTGKVSKHRNPETLPGENFAVPHLHKMVQPYGIAISRPLPEEEVEKQQTGAGNRQNMFREHHKLLYGVEPSVDTTKEAFPDNVAPLWSGIYPPGDARWDMASPYFI